MPLIWRIRYPIYTIEETLIQRHHGALLRNDANVASVNQSQVADSPSFIELEVTFREFMTGPENAELQALPRRYPVDRIYTVPHGLLGRIPMPADQGSTLPRALGRVANFWMTVPGQVRNPVPEIPLFVEGHGHPHPLDGGSMIVGTTMGVEPPIQARYTRQARGSELAADQSAGAQGWPWSYGTQSGDITNEAGEVVGHVEDLQVVTTSLFQREHYDIEYLIQDNVPYLYGTHTVPYVMGVVPGLTVLLTNQLNPVENGIWRVQNGPWIRDHDHFPAVVVADGIRIHILRGDGVGEIWSCLRGGAVGRDEQRWVLEHVSPPAPAPAHPETPDWLVPGVQMIRTTSIGSREYLHFRVKEVRRPPGSPPYVVGFYGDETEESQYRLSDLLANYEVVRPSATSWKKILEDVDFGED